MKKNSNLYLFLLAILLSALFVWLIIRNNSNEPFENTFKIENNLQCPTLDDFVNGSYKGNWLVTEIQKTTTPPEAYYVPQRIGPLEKALSGGHDGILFEWTPGIGKNWNVKITYGSETATVEFIYIEKNNNYVSFSNDPRETSRYVITPISCFPTFS